MSSNTAIVLIILGWFGLIASMFIISDDPDKDASKNAEQQYSRAAEFCATQPGMIDCVREVVKVCQ